MPLEPPNLDTRTFDQLVRELRLRIPRYTPEWTDFNESDPGMTLVELFAWLTETILYELNRVPDRNYLKFLQLLNMELRPAQPAVADLEFTPRAGANVRTVLAGSKLAAQPASGGEPLIFETETDLAPTPVPLLDVQVFDGTAFTVRTPENQTAGLPYRPLGFAPQLGSALYLGFAPPAPAGTHGSLPDELRFRVFLPEATGRGRPQRCQPATAPPPPPVQLAWEYLPEQDARWRRLNLFGDDSARFTREGYVLVQGPRRIGPTVLGRVDEPRLWLRIRLEAGSYPTGEVPELDFIRVNVVPARNLSTVTDELVGTSDGRPGQVLRLRRRPVAAGSLVIETQVGDSDAELWEARDDFLDSGPEDRHYVLNANRGEIRFGDGRQGRIPTDDGDIIARRYRYGGGEAGNVAAGQISTPVTTLVGIESVRNPRPAVGGANEQSVEDLMLRAPREIRRRNRAVTGPDFTSLAEEVGGVRRATALALVHPDHPDVEVPGTVTVVVVPDSPDLPPQPSSDLIRAVCRYLEDYRLLTTELFVRGPQYQRITVQARITAQPYAAPDEVERKVLDRLGRALDPLARQHEFGADFHPTSLYAVILGEPDVVSVEALTVAVDGLPHQLTDPVVVPPDGLVYGADHDLVVAPATDQ